MEDADRFYNDQHLLSHRGPDHTDAVRMGEFYARHWRLSILDLSPTGNQPKIISEKQLVFVYNGEIYNFRELAASMGLTVTGDTDFLFQALQMGCWESIRHKLRGFYSFVYYDGLRKTICGNRDPFGKKPLFYCLSDGYLVLASEECAILHYINRGVSSDSLAEYFLYKGMFHGKSAYENIQQIPPGTAFHFDISTWVFTSAAWHEYYLGSSNIDGQGRERISRASTCELDRNLEEELRAALKYRLVSDVPIAFALSGGVDSTLLFKFLEGNPSLDQYFAVYSVDFEGSEYNELSFARDILKSSTVNNYAIKFPKQDLYELLKIVILHVRRPLDHPHYLSSFLLCQEVSKQFKVLLTGEGADELFMGYDHYAEFEQSPASFAYREFLGEDDERAFEGDSAFRAIRESSKLGEYRQLALFSRSLARNHEMKTHLDSLLMRNDKMSMANHLEIRCPFLDCSVKRFAEILPDDYLVENKVTKAPLKRMVAKMIRNYDPYRRKVGFRVPFDEWYEQNYAEKKVVESIDVAVDFMRDRHNLRYIPKINRKISNRLAWVMLNIGLFISSN